MRRRYIIGALLGVLLGFAGQFFVDFFCWTPGNNGTLYQFFSDKYFERNMARWVRAPQLQSKAHQLVYQVVFLYWLSERGPSACGTAVIVAFLGASSLLAADYLQHRSKNHQ